MIEFTTRESVSSNFLMMNFLDSFFHSDRQDMDSVKSYFSILFKPAESSVIYYWPDKCLYWQDSSLEKRHVCPGFPPSLSFLAPEWDIINYETCDSSFYNKILTSNYSCFVSNLNHLIAENVKHFLVSDSPKWGFKSFGLLVRQNNTTEETPLGLEKVRLKFFTFLTFNTPNNESIN